MKKIFCLLMIFCVIITFAGCGKATSKGSDYSSMPSKTVSKSESESTSTLENDVVSEDTANTSDVTSTTATTSVSSETDQFANVPTGTATPKDHKHSYKKSKTVKPTCTEAGYTLYKCDCGDSYKEDVKQATGHDFGEWKTVKKATTKAEGTAERKCKNCGEKETRSIPKEIPGHTHNYTSSVTKAATCLAEGVKTFTCSCGASYTEAIPATGHNYVKENTVAPTCTANGYTVYKCKNCESTYNNDYKNALGHNYTSKVVAPTCINSGYTVHTCSRCNHSYSDNKVNATGHKHTRVETEAATCGTEGYEKIFCTDCNALISYKTLPATHNHNWVTKTAIQANKDACATGNYMIMAQSNNMAKLKNDWLVDACSQCGCINPTTIRCAYTPREAAEIMLGYVNALREEVYGTDFYNLELSDKLIELANQRAIEIQTHYNHDGAPGAENIANCHTLIEYFEAWKSSTGHYNNMINKRVKWFGFGMQLMPGTKSNIYGVQLFWDESYCDSYYIEHQDEEFQP